jgi:DNA-binding transcriptional LysR family regulator
LAAVSAAEAALEHFHAGAPRIRVAAFPSALSSFVPAAVRELRRSHPKLVVQVLQHETQEAIERLRGGEADVAVVHYIPGVAVPETAGLKRAHLLVDHLYVVVPERHRLARRDAIRIADLESEPLILPRRDTPAGRFRSLIEHLCAQVGFEPQVAYELDDLPAVQAFVAAGVAIVPMHGLTLSTMPRGAVARVIADRSAGSRTIEALANTSATTAAVADLLARLENAAAAYTPAAGQGF